MNIIFRQVLLKTNIAQVLVLNQEGGIHSDEGGGVRIKGHFFLRYREQGVISFLKHLPPAHVADRGPKTLSHVLFEQSFTNCMWCFVSVDFVTVSIESRNQPTLFGDHT